MKRTRNIVNGVKFWLVLFVLASSFGPMLVSADVVWSDNFDGNDYDDWTVQHGEFSAADGYLKSTETVGGWYSSYLMAMISHDSNVTTGTWSFDYYQASTSNQWPNGGVTILIEEEDVQEKNFGAIDIEIADTFIALWNPTEKVASWSSNFENTWTHVDVTVDENSNVDVFVNDTHRIHYTTTGLTGDYQYIVFWSSVVGQAIDNIVVSDSIDYVSLPFNTTPTTASPTPTTPPDGGIDTTMMLLVGGGVAVIVVIVLVVWKARGR
ncbi:MAG: hypothetical protein ACW98Y_21090 [Candidatus Thorarchaeota archaeon]